MNMFVTNILFAIVLLILFRVYLLFKNRYCYWQNRGVKVIEPLWLPLGNFWSFFTRNKALGHVLAEWYETVDSEVIGLYALDEPILLVKDPDLIRDILVKDFNSFTDRGIFMDKSDELSGQLWKLPGFKWRPLRTKMSSCFTISKLKMMFSNLLNAGTEMEQFLEKAVGEAPIDGRDLSKRFSADIIGQSIFGLEVKSFREQNNDFVKIIDCVFDNSSKKNMIKTALQVFAPNFFDYINFVKFETVNPAAITFLYKMVEKIMDFREKTGTVGNDMIQLLIQLKKFGKVDDDGGEKEVSENEVCLTMDEVVAQAYTYFFTGNETASSTLTLLLYECSLNEEIQTKLQADIDQAIASAGGKLTYEAILEMKYLNMVIAETLRKYPILQYLVRKNVVDYRFEKIDLNLREGTRVYISIHGLHRDEKYYPDPEMFDPERFSKENLTSRHPMSYLPYGEGPRNCIGKRMGYFMVAVGAIYIFRKFNVKPSGEWDVPLKLHPYTYTIRSINPIMLKISRR